MISGVWYLVVNSAQSMRLLHRGTGVSKEGVDMGRDQERKGNRVQLVIKTG